jgi:TRAP-type C4-dicarboxylate transport system permease small subunit
MSAARGPTALLGRAEAGLEALLRLVVGASMLAAVALNFANVIARYVFLSPFIWAEETLQFLNVWAVLLGAAVVTRRNQHLKMDALHGAVPPGVRRAFDAVAAALAVVVGLYVTVQALDMIRMLATTGQRSVIARVPMDLMYLAIPVGFGSGVLFVALGLRRLRRARREAETATPEAA